tara:strand:+ start:111 stop:569 length:459 start_codon:yes stop_codon:yes gene_type:complete
MSDETHVIIMSPKRDFGYKFPEGSTPASFILELAQQENDASRERFLHSGASKYGARLLSSSEKKGFSGVIVDGNVRLSSTHYAALETMSDQARKNLAGVIGWSADEDPIASRLRKEGPKFSGTYRGYSGRTARGKGNGKGKGSSNYLSGEEN